MSIHKFQNQQPQLAPDVFLAAGAHVIGDVHIGQGSSIWFNTVVRGDGNFIRIGKKTNIQDLSLVHINSELYPTYIGDEVTVGHRSVIHACKIGDRCLIGMGAIIMDGAVVGDDCLIGAGSLVKEGMQIPAGSVAMGSPAVIKRALTQKEKDWIKKSAENYYQLAKKYQDL